MKDSSVFAGEVGVGAASLDGGEATSVRVVRGCDGSPAFSEVEGSRGVFDGVLASLDRRGGLRILPSAFCWFSVGDGACALLRCLFDGMPLADAKLLAIEEPTSRCGRCAAGRLCD